MTRLIAIVTTATTADDARRAAAQRLVAFRKER
jgi:hypothetical protein